MASKKGRDSLVEWKATHTAEENHLRLKKMAAQHKLSRIKNSLADDMDIILKSKKGEIISLLLEGAGEIMKQAIIDKDPHAWATVYDRVIGKRKESPNTTPRAASRTVITTTVLRYDGQQPQEEETNTFTVDNDDYSEDL